MMTNRVRSPKQDGLRIEYTSDLVMWPTNVWLTLVNWVGLRKKRFALNERKLESSWKVLRICLRFEHVSRIHGEKKRDPSGCQKQVMVIVTGILMMKNQLSSLRWFTTTWTRVIGFQSELRTTVSPANRYNWLITPFKLHITLVCRSYCPIWGPVKGHNFRGHSLVLLDTAPLVVLVPSTDVFWWWAHDDVCRRYVLRGFKECMICPNAVYMRHGAMTQKLGFSNPYWGMIRLLLDGHLGLIAI